MTGDSGRGVCKNDRDDDGRESGSFSESGEGFAGECSI